MIKLNIPLMFIKSHFKTIKKLNVLNVQRMFLNLIPLSKMLAKCFKNVFLLAGSDERRFSCCAEQSNNLHYINLYKTTQHCSCLRHSMISEELHVRMCVNAHGNGYLYLNLMDAMITHHLLSFAPYTHK